MKIQKIKDRITKEVLFGLTITVKCNRLTASQATAEITYTFIGLNELGNTINEHSIQVMYKNNLKDWEKQINYYLANGKKLRE